MKKRLHTDAIANELKGGSAFFPDYAAGSSEARDETVVDASSDRDPSPALEVSPAPAEPAGAQKSPKASEPSLQKTQARHENTESRHHDTMVSRHHGITTP
jgi:hypothetical protein